VIDPHRVLTNQGAQPGDRLLFTKPLGTGVISTAIKKGVARQEWIDAAVKSMTTLNKAAAGVITGVGTGDPSTSSGQALAGPAERSSAANDQRPTTKDSFTVHALTDVTGFGLIGHARELTLGSGVSLVFHWAHIPVLEGALDCIHAGYIPGGLKANRDFAECLVEYDPLVPDDIRMLLFDPQTAGGLLISVSAEEAGRLVRALHDAGVPAVEIGEVLPHTKPLIRVTS